ncbi:hypothetical protein [Rhodococcus koreensis]
MPRPPNAHEISQAVALVRQRMAAEGNKGYVVVYAPRWLCGDSLTGDYDLWNSDYDGSGAPRPFRDQYQGVTDVGHGWDPISSRNPRILQFASDSTIGKQTTCDVNKFDGDLFDLIRLCGREPLLPNQDMLESWVQLLGEGGMGWPQLASHTLVDGFAAVGQKEGIRGFAPLMVRPMCSTRRHHRPDPRPLGPIGRGRPHRLAATRRPHPRRRLATVGQQQGITGFAAPAVVQSSPTSRTPGVDALKANTVQLVGFALR